MFVHGLEKTAAIRPLKLVKNHSNIDPVTRRDVFNLRETPSFSSPISRFANGHKPRMALKAMSNVRSHGA